MKRKLKVLLMALTFALTLPFFASLKNKKVKAYTASDIVFYGNDVSYWQGNVNFSKRRNRRIYQKLYERLVGYILRKRRPLCHERCGLGF